MIKEFYCGKYLVVSFDIIDSYIVLSIDRGLI